MPERRPLTPTLQAAFAALAVAVVVLAAGPGCIFFVGDANGLQTKVCPFQGSTTACGQCIAQLCQPKVDACCAASDCRDSLSNLDACATSGTQLACSTLMTGVSLNGSTDFNALGSCTTQCATACNGTGTINPFGGDAAVGPTYPLACSTSNDTCFCEATTAGTPATCNANMFQNGICCADRNYPSSGNCTCNPFACTYDTNSGCQCSAVYDSASGVSPDSCPNQNCCVEIPGLCSCPNDTSVGCSSGISVSGCTVVNTGCSGEQFQVNQCYPLPG